MSSSVTTNPRMASATNTANPASSTAATISLAADPGGSLPGTVTKANSRWICTAITVTSASGATAQTPIVVNLRDGATGAGTVVWSGVLSHPANQCASLMATDLAIRGSANTAMTLEFAGVSVANAAQTVSLSAYLEDLTGP